MFNFSNRSQNNLNTCHPNLIELFEEGIKRTPIDYSIICGHRGEKDQDEAVKKGNSKLNFPRSMHNQNPSLATDIQPYPYTKEDQEADKRGDLDTKFKRLTYFLADLAKEMDIPVFNGGMKWGWDWYHWQLIV